MPVEYLIRTTKVEILGVLERSIALGGVDAELLPYIQRINEVPGCCILEGCIGHDESETGYLTILYTKGFERAIFELLSDFVIRWGKGKELRRCSIVFVDPHNAYIEFLFPEGCYPVISIRFEPGNTEVLSDLADKLEKYWRKYC